MKKVLFVCRGNLCRSQVAQSFYNQKYPEHPSFSAGTQVDFPGQVISEHPTVTNTIAVMQEKNIDISHNTATQLTEKMVDDFDTIIVMAEALTIPAYLKNSPKFEYWEVVDMYGLDLPQTRQLRDQIEKLVLKRF
jgi:protein-tyrosine phosphatase